VIVLDELWLCLEVMGVGRDQRTLEERGEGPNLEEGFRGVLKISKLIHSFLKSSDIFLG